MLDTFGDIDVGETGEQSCAWPSLYWGRLHNDDWLTALRRPWML